MKKVLLISIALIVTSFQAHAAIVQSSSLPSGPFSSPIPDAFTPTVSTNLTTSVSGVYRSPFEGTASPNAPFTSIEGNGSATFNESGNTFSFIWGSPDTYNDLSVYSQANGGGSLLATITGSAINPADGTGFSYVTISGLGHFGSLVFDNSANPGAGSNAFEISTLSVSSVPLPASFPLFGGGLLALATLGYLSRSKKTQGCPDMELNESRA